MSYNNNYNTNYQNPQIVNYAATDAQAEFYRKTYTHVALALLAFIGVEAALQNLIPEELIFSMIRGKFVWLFILGGFKIALLYTGTAILSQAGIITLALFGGLTAVVFLTRVDFSFLRTILVVGGFVALGLIVAGAIFGFDLGLWFSVAMVALAAGGILYETYNIKNAYSTDQYVAAALQLFSSIMLLFWYILRILMSRRD